MSGFSFGSPAPATTTTATGFSFGTPQTSTVTGVQTGFGTSTGFSFGSSTPATNTGLNLSFGTPTPQAASTTSAAPTIGLLSNPSATTTTTVSTTQFSFGGLSQATPSNTLTSTTQTATVAPLTFGATAPTTTTSATPSFGFGTASISNVATTTTASTIANPSLSLSTTTNQQPLSLFGAGLTNTTTTVSTLTSQIQTQSTMASQPTTSTTTNAFVGLGGIDMSATAQQKAPQGKIETTKVKETPIPAQIVQSIEEFKTYVKNQKTISSEITRSSDRKQKTVTEELQRLNCLLQESSNNIDNNRLLLKHLRNETVKVIENADMAQRTHDTPSGLQFENVMPQVYFKELIQKYESDLLGLKHQVELTEKHLQSLVTPQNFTAQDLKRGLQQIHESFIALAGRLQEAHTKVENQKTHFLELRKFILKDSTNVFEVEENSSEIDKLQTNRVQYGPNTFSSSAQHGLLNMISMNRGAQQQQQNQPFQMPNLNASSIQPQGIQNTNIFGTNTLNFNFNK